MKNVHLFMLSTVAALFSTTSFAAEQIQCSEAVSLTKVATISSLGASSPNELMSELSAKVDAMGATKFRIVSMTGQDGNERGTAIAYR